MFDTVGRTYRRLDDLRPLVRPTYSEFEVRFLPPFGDPEVHVLGEVGTYLAAGLVVNALAESLQDDAHRG